MMQSQAERGASVISNGDRPKPLSVEDAVGSAFVQLLAEARDQDQRNDSPNSEVIQAFVKDVRRRKKQPQGFYDDFVDLAATAAVRVLVYGSNCPEDRKDPASLTLYRRMLRLVKRASSGAPLDSVSRPQSVVESPNGLEGDRKVETIERQELLNEAYDSGYSTGFEAGVRAEAAKHQNNPTETEGTYAQGFAAGQRRLMDSEIAFAFARGQIAEQQRIRAYLDEGAIQIGQANGIPGPSLEMAAEPSEVALQTTPLDASTQDPSAQQSDLHSSKDSYFSRTDSPIRPPESTMESDTLKKSPTHPPPAFRYPEPISHGTDGHNFTPPGDPNALTENIKYIKRFPTNLLISIIAEAARQLNAVKLRIQDLEAQFRQRNPSYISQHALPNVHILHESRQEVLSAILANREQLPPMLQELRQLTRARGLRSQIRNDEGTWWEVADDLEAGLDPSSKLAQAVVALPPPGEVPIVHLVGANMNHPTWRPKYALPLQAGWELKGPDENPVWVPPGFGAQRDSLSAAKPASFHPVSVFQDGEGDKEEDDGYQKLMVEITSRVQQSDWDHSSSDEGGDDSDDAGINAAQPPPTKREASQERERPVATAASSRRTKRRRAA
ncbi:hypothetical protein Daus18300_005252 [Diaporthe australafricana]|uniref:Uncharacterized protein n=1 Tax=Diaporthe australafricana TaxID=127596 RepID=A0ABR3X2T3_9PEZI